MMLQKQLYVTLVYIDYRNIYANAVKNNYFISLHLMSTRNNWSEIEHIIFRAVFILLDIQNVSSKLNKTERYVKSQITYFKLDFSKFTFLIHVHIQLNLQFKFTIFRANFFFIHRISIFRYNFQRRPFRRKRMSYYNCITRTYN